MTGGSYLPTRVKHATIRPWPNVMNVPMDRWEAIVFTCGGATIRFTPQEFMAALRNLSGQQPAPAADTDLDAIEAAALAAGGEEWRQVKPGHPIMTPEYVVGPDPLRARAVAFGPARNFEEQMENYSRRKAETYAAHIAAANPAAVLALIQRVREAEGHRNDQASALTELLAAAEECASDLACHVNTITTGNDRRLYDSERRRHETDMAPVSRLRAAVARVRGE